MSYICGNDGLKIKIKGISQIKALARKRVTPKIKILGSSKLTALLSVTYAGVARGSGGAVLSQSFGSQNFAASPALPNIYLRSFRGNSSLKIKKTKLAIRRSVDNISEVLFDKSSQEYITYGKSSIPDSVYEPINSNNHTFVTSVGPLIYHSLSSEKKRSSNSKFIANITRPVNKIKCKVVGRGKVRSKYFEKLHGFFKQIQGIPDFVATDKLYPIRDIQTSNGDVSFVTEKLKSSGIYSSINEGIFTGNITNRYQSGSLISDDISTFITPSSIYTAGSFTYKCEVNAPSITPLESFLFLRASAPIFNVESDIPPIYKISNIKLEDPSGNLIVKYKDFQIEGQQNYEDPHHYHFVTYVTEPEINYAKLKTWEYYYPVLGEASGYTLTMDIDGNCFYKPFDPNFNKGFQQECNLDDRFVPSSLSNYMAIDGSPMSTRSNNYNIRPINALRISAIEINNRGMDGGILSDSQIPLFLDVVPHGEMISRSILPTKVLAHNFEHNIHPTGTTNVWSSSPDIEGNIFDNTSNDARSNFELVQSLTNLYRQGNITLDQALPVQASGKLQLLYEHKAPYKVKEQRGGSFNLGNKYSNPFSRSQIELVKGDDSFFVVDSITLKLSAKKAPNTPDFPIDVVGYSDDGILFITPQVGGFLQNELTGSGVVPQVSGSFLSDYNGVSNKAISDKPSFYSQDITNIAAGDHYKIDRSILVNSEVFKTYEIPLKVYPELVSLGKAKDYSMSTYFESLYVDIYPIPSGASIQSANLIVTYRPTGALGLYSFGRDEKNIFSRRSVLHPTKIKSSDTRHTHAGSSIENIPHAYSTTEPTLKTNYSRRWRGCSGQVSYGSFDPSEFSFSFNFETLDQPFTIGHYDFSNTEGNAVLSAGASSSISGVFSNSISANNLIRNLGMRFSSDLLFSSQSLPYRTLDWTPASHELNNKISDAFDYAVRISGVNNYIDFGNTPTASGFAIFLRFSPDVTMSGVNYNLWNSGVLFQKQDAGQDLEYGLKYNNGYLQGFARDSGGNVITVNDDLSYASYDYPLSVMLTYNAGGDQKLKLYAAQENYFNAFGGLNPPEPRLRSSSSPFVMHSGNSNLTFGYSEESGVGMNCFITEIGLSGPNASGHSNIVDQNPNISLQEEAADIFFDSHSVQFLYSLDDNSLEFADPNPLWKFIDEPTDSWDLGSFKYCSFGESFDIMTVRIGRDYVYHKYNHDGLTYADRIETNLPESLSHASGLAYHTQIENDMLRFNLSGRENRFFSIPPRITKDLPRGYVFNEDGLRVNTVIQQENGGDILWPNGNRGAKLIVSLYTPAKESELIPSVNYGLLSRDVHYLNPEDCWIKTKSLFTISQYKDNDSEPWAYFDKTITSKELQENYFNREIDEMFVQYDLVYPSGSYGYSKVKIHSLDVSLENALLFEENANAKQNLVCSGDAYSQNHVDISTAGYGIAIANSGLNLYASGVDYTTLSSGIDLVSSGTYQINSYIPMYTVQVGTATSSEGFGSELFGTSYIGVSLHSEGGFPYSYDDLNMYMDGTHEDLRSINNTLRLLLPDRDFGFPKENNLDLFLYSDIVFIPNPPINVKSSFNLYVSGPDYVIKNTDTSLNLILETRVPVYGVDGQLHLSTLNTKPISKQENQDESFVWNSQNYGFAIDVLDNSFASIPANDDIRGVQTICYGDCESVGNISCQENELITHDTLWNQSLCVDGGVARSIRTYTNDDANAFGDPNQTYNNHYYGIRKFTGLIPQAPYNITITGKTASDKILEVPREIREWEYGTNEDVDYSGIKLTASNSNIGENKHFGQDVTTLRDMVAISSPYETIEVGVDDTLNSDTASYQLHNAGKIYIYRKDVEPSGSDWSNQPDKSPLVLEQELVLPVGMRRDYFTTNQAIFYDNAGNKLPFEATIRNWQNFGEGRNLGYSLDSTSRDGHDIIVAGAPGTSWSRTFAPIQTTPVKIALFIFNNELVTNPTGRNWSEIVKALKDKDLIYRYFSDPPVEFDIQIVLCEPMLGADLGYQSSEDFNIPQPDFISKYVTNRHFNLNYNSQAYKDQDDIMFQELVDIYQENFPLEANALHSGIPPLVCMYIDGSRSLGELPLGYFGSDGEREGALDRFIKYIEEYSINNGLRDFAGNQASSYVKAIVSQDEDWITQSIVALDSITDSDELKQNGAFTLIANNIGTFNSNAGEFNNPPPSGGAVFVFDKSSESGSEFKLSQVIHSPSTYTDDVSDRFGHDVAISEDGNIIVIGSPFCDAAVQIWERNYYYESQLNNAIISNFLPAFLTQEKEVEVNNATFGEAYSAYNDYYNALPNTSSVAQLRRDTYNAFSESLRFKFHTRGYIHPYYLLRTVKYSDVFYDTGGVWSRFYNKYIPTARMGYSVDVNEDGSLVAIGCPTDSFGERDSTITWFRYDDKFPPFGEQTTLVGGENWQWQNYTNAGSVRLLESRNYYPHSNKVVEYYKFGNLHELLSDQEDSSFFEPAMRNMFSSRKFEYQRTSFSEDKKIPQDAGLAFIITPAIDAASEEILDNIREWLSYGDRHLVLVGNDPEWEAGGAYKGSNDVINKILSALDVNMRIYPARNKYEALIDDTGLYYNVDQSYVPAKTTSTISSYQSLRGYGVGDIRFYDPGKSDLYKCTLPYGTKLTSNGELTEDYSDPFAILEKIDQPEDIKRKKIYRELHNICEMPIIHEGDLRAKYIDQCLYRPCTGDTTYLNYEHNLAYMYGSHTTCNDWGCTTCDEVCPPVLSVNERNASEPVPILAAYESVKRTVHVPAIPEREGVRRVLVGYEYEPYQKFGEGSYSGIDFMWSADSGNYASLSYNINNIESKSLFYDPEEYNGVDAILQSTSSSPLEDVEKIVYSQDQFYFMVEEKLPENPDSSVVLIAGTLTENREALLSGSGDSNLNFYFNLLAKDAFGNSKVAQVGGFTNRASYKDGYHLSDIQNQMFSLGIDMSSTNVSTKSLFDLTFGYDVAWIANTDQYPSDQDIENIKRFLSLGNKKLIITYGQDPSSTIKAGLSAMSEHTIAAAKVATYICKKLGVSMEPLFLEGRNRYANKSDTDTIKPNRDLNDTTVQSEFDSQYSHDLAVTSYIQSGFDNTSRIKSSVYRIDLDCYTYRNEVYCDGYYHECIPIKKTASSVGLAFFRVPVLDIESQPFGVTTFNTGLTRVVFDVPEPREDVPENDTYNLFKLFFKVRSESELESQSISVFVKSCATWVGGPIGNELVIKDTDDYGQVFPTKIICGLSTSLNTKNEKEFEFNIQIPSGQHQLEMLFQATGVYEPQNNPPRIRTNRLVSVSGVRIPVEETFGQKPIYENQTYIIPAKEAYSYEANFNRQISTSSDKYCLGNSAICAEDEPIGYGKNVPEIADGPIVVAQAVYHQGGFFSGYNKSRITVISDASLIQGRTIASEDQSVVNPKLVRFLTSLYPYTFFPADMDPFEGFGRQYETNYKIISPERNSPSRLINAYPDNSGLNYRFGQYASNNLSVSDYTDDEGKKMILPEPTKNFVRQPFDKMNGLMSAYFPFRDPPEAPAFSPGDWFALGNTINGMNKEQYEDYWYRQQFEQVQEHYSSTSKFKDFYNYKYYEDAGYQERIPQLMRETGKDHLDFEAFPSGYPGDLFGYKVKLHKGRLYVGSPFSAYKEEYSIKWNDVVANTVSGIYGTDVGHNGGAGSVYLIEKISNSGTGYGSVNSSKEITSGLPWDVSRKFRPKSISVGHEGLNQSSSQDVLGPNNYTDDFLQTNALLSDMFGYDIDVAADILAISAPRHSFETFLEKTPAEFVRKEFNNQFDITNIIPRDMAVVQNIQNYPGSGIPVINHGAVYTYENRIDDWGSKSQEWSEIHKLVSNASPRDRVQGSGENLMFGHSISLDRSRRNDADYMLSIGSRNHNLPYANEVQVSGAGATFVYNGMLRKLRPAFSHPDTYMAGRVYGEYTRDSDYLKFYFANGETPDSNVYFEGRAWSDIDGQIYVEVSGQDKTNSYVVHRPYIHEIRGSFAHGKSELESISLYSDGINPPASSVLNLISKAPDTGMVYNSLELYGYCGVHNSGQLHLFASGMEFGYESFFDQESVDSKTLKETINNASSMALLVGRGGFNARRK
jgi:hypothetical protein